MKLFENASLPTSSNAFKRVNILFDTKIIKISTDPIESEEEPERIDLKGKVILPGGIEPHLHILQGKKQMPAALERVSRLALKGGWSCLAEMSFTSEMPIFTNKQLKEQIALIEAHSAADMALWGNVDIFDYPYHAEVAQELWSKGVVGIALFTPSPNPKLQALSFTEMMDLFLDIYESDTEFAFQGWDNESHVEYSLESQLDGIKKILRRMQENPIHIPRVSKYPIIEFINSISKRSDISFAMNIADLMHLLDAERFPAPWATDFAEHSQLLIDLLKTNKIYLLSNSCGAQEDECELFWGASEEILPYSYHWVLSELWKARKIPLATCIKMTGENAAKRLGIYPQKGCIAAGSDADFVIYDPEGFSTYTSPNGKSLELTGKIDSVYLRGEKYLDKKPTKGSFIPRVQSPKRRHNNSTWI